MSSPPTPNTSIKAAPLSGRKTRDKSSSFPSIATLKIFRKKPPPQASSPVEPHEFAPGIWSTDTTARVFGYLDINNSEQAFFVDRTEQCNTDKLRDKAEAPAQFKQKGRDEKETQQGGNWSGVRQGRMGTVSRDDQLVERGANPRTGLVSPFVVSDNSEECLAGDYIAGDKLVSPSLSLGRRTRSGKWRQDSLGWSLVESPLSSPIAQSMSDKMSRTVSMKQSEDPLLVEMPGVDNLDPKNMTDEQIKKYHEGVARAYKHRGGSVAMLDPDTLLFPRTWTPEGPSTPPTKLHKIRRKEVGSGVVRKSISGDTVIVNVDNRASSLPTPRKDITKRQKVRIITPITPSNTPKGSSFESYANVSNAMRKTDPFLGRTSQMMCSQIASATQSQSYLNTGEAHQSRQNEPESSPSSTSSGPPLAPQTLSQYLPRLQFLYPGHFANLETSSSRRPTQLRQRLLGQQRRAVEGACTTTSTTTSTKGPRWEQRPKMQRQDGNDVVPRVNHLLPEYERPLDGYHRASTIMDKQFYPSDIQVDTLYTSGFMVGRSRALELQEKADPARDLANTRYQSKTQMPAEQLRQPPCENRRNANVARERIQRNQSGDGCTHTYGHLGNESMAVAAGSLQYISNDKEQVNLPAEFTVCDGSRVWCAGLWAKVGEKGERPDLLASMQEDTLAHERSVLRIVFHRMIRHVMRTVHHTSLALITPKSANATQQDHLRAMKDLALAALCLLVLLNLLMVLRRVLIFVCKVLYYAWHPVQTILRIIGWCLVG